jgi:hypothetical protein
LCVNSDAFITAAAVCIFFDVEIRIILICEMRNQYQINMLSDFHKGFREERRASPLLKEDELIE